MRIAFNFHDVGAGNNGGTRTIFKSAMALSELGHSVHMWSNFPSRFTWFKLPHNIPFLVRKSIQNHKPVDVLIATGADSVRSTLAFKDKGIGAYWIRGIETWNQSKEELIKGYGSGLKLIGNSERIVQWLKTEADLKCELVRAGVEWTMFSPLLHFLNCILIGLTSLHAQSHILTKDAWIQDDVKELFPTSDTP